jgi:hypothetical protein
MGNRGKYREHVGNLLTGMCNLAENIYIKHKERYIIEGGLLIFWSTSAANLSLPTILV